MGIILKEPKAQEREYIKVDRNGFQIISDNNIADRAESYISKAIKAQAEGQLFNSAVFFGTAARWYERLATYNVGIPAVAESANAAASQARNRAAENALNSGSSIKDLDAAVSAELDKVRAFGSTARGSKLSF